MQQLIDETTSAAEKLFKGLTVRLWIVKRGPRERPVWHCRVINTDNKITLAMGANRSSPAAAVKAVKAQLEMIVGRTSKSS